MGLVLLERNPCLQGSFAGRKQEVLVQMFALGGWKETILEEGVAELWVYPQFCR